MQGPGDVLYVPRNWWHATVALGEGIGVSGQFVRLANKILQDAQTALQAGDYATATKLYKRVWNHRDDMEKPVALAVLLNAAVSEFKAGKCKSAQSITNKYLRVLPNYPGVQPDLKKAEAILQECRKILQAKGEL